MGILRLGHLEIRVKENSRAAQYYTQVFGLKETARVAGKIYLKAWDEWEHHQLVLVEDPTPGSTTWPSAESLDDLAIFENRLEQQRLSCAAGLRRRGARVRRGDPVHRSQ